jgi:hypothetical protein
MAHFAKLDENNVVVAVHVLDNSVINVDGNELESIGVEFLSNLHGHLNWKQTSYNKSFRKNYASVGFIYDEERDAFIPPKIYNSWILNEDTCLWESPIPYPTSELEDTTPWIWDEISNSWVDEREINFAGVGKTNV